MKAAVLRELQMPMGIEDLAITKPAPREVLVRLAAVGVCHSDLHIITGDLPHPLPAVLGHEAAGVVEQVGSDVRSVKPGDHVIVCLTFHCGHCEQCETGNSHRCMPDEAARSASEAPRRNLSRRRSRSGMRGRTACPAKSVRSRFHAPASARQMRPCS